MTTAAKGYEVKYDDGCPVGAAIEAGKTWDGGTCPQCGATGVGEACFRWIPRSEHMSKERRRR